MEQWADVVWKVSDVTLRRELAGTLVSEGFRGDAGAYRRPIDEQWSLVVGVGPLNRRTDVSPQVGIRSEPVESLTEVLCDLPESPYAATVGANVGYVLGNDYTIWEPPTTTFDVLARIHIAIDVLRPYTSLERIPQAFQDIPEAAANPSTHYRLVVVQLLLENRAGVLGELEAARAEYCKYDDEICETFNRFREKVLVHVSST